MAVPEIYHLTYRKNMKIACWVGISECMRNSETNADIKIFSLLKIVFISNKVVFIVYI